MKRRDQVTVVVGGQAGSEGKGAVCGNIHRRQAYDVAVRVGGPNAGHTVVDSYGKRWALRQLPVAAVADPDTELVIAAGSEIDLEVLRDEVGELEEAGIRVRDRLLIDETATIIDREAVDLECNIKTGTTAKGIGGARARRALRQAKLAYDHGPWFREHGLRLEETQGKLRDRVRLDDRVLIEGTQGYVLGTHAGYYPYATSGDCRAQDFMAWCGLPPMTAYVWVVCRMHPIRIAGNSGPLPNETTWEQLGIEPERTTDTKKIRRVADWNWEWVHHSINANIGPDEEGRPYGAIALTFADYRWPELAYASGARRVSHLPKETREFVEQIKHMTGIRVRMLGTGPMSAIWLADY